MLMADPRRAPEQARQLGAGARHPHGHVVFADADNVGDLGVAQAFERQHDDLPQAERQRLHRGLQALVPLLLRERVLRIGSRDAATGASSSSELHPPPLPMLDVADRAVVGDPKHERPLRTRRRESAAAPARRRARCPGPDPAAAPGRARNWVPAAAARVVLLQQPRAMSELSGPRRSPAVPPQHRLAAQQPRRAHRHCRRGERHHRQPARPGARRRLAPDEIDDEHVLAEHGANPIQGAGWSVPNAKRKPGIIGAKMSNDSWVCASL